MLTEAEHQRLLRLIDNLLDDRTWLGSKFLGTNVQSDQMLWDLHNVKLKLHRALRK